MYKPVEFAQKAQMHGKTFNCGVSYIETCYTPRE